MGTGWSQDEASQSQQQSPAQPSNNAAVEKCTLRNKSEINQQEHEHQSVSLLFFFFLPRVLTMSLLLQKYWVDKKSNNCFMVYPRDLKITWAEDNRYWRWPSLEETSNVFIDAAELLNVCWLEVHGKIDSTKLSPGTLYEVVFIVMLKAAANNWKVPVNVRLTLPDGNKQGRKAELNKIPREQWTEIPIGEFKASPGLSGNIEFSMYEYDDGKWKSGLLIRGVAIRPKN
ncbi:lectin-like isoform X2 [Argentina anserina]|uniref:lectin-like isoform X2 n=1 Tax=Argentina anserina TaxID=57926 RepID=UPI0021764629|nr:lectin-like isoform X2 [Potentilla anserina]